MMGWSPRVCQPCRGGEFVPRDPAVGENLLETSPALTPVVGQSNFPSVAPPPFIDIEPTLSTDPIDRPRSLPKS